MIMTLLAFILSAGEIAGAETERPAADTIEFMEASRDSRAVANFFAMMLALEALGDGPV